MTLDLNNLLNQLNAVPRPINDVVIQTHNGYVVIDDIKIINNVVYIIPASPITLRDNADTQLHITLHHPATLEEKTGEK